MSKFEEKKGYLLDGLKNLKISFNNLLERQVSFVDIKKRAKQFYDTVYDSDIYDLTRAVRGIYLSIKNSRAERLSEEIVKGLSGVIRELKEKISREKVNEIILN